MPSEGVRAGIGIGPPAAETRPNGLGVTDAVAVQLVGPDGTVQLAAAPLPRMVLGPFTFALNPRDTLAVTEPPLLAMHSPPGGTPRYQFMGRGETQLRFRGTLSGDAALQDLAALRALNGTRQPWSFGPLSAALCWVRVDWAYGRDDELTYELQLAVEGEVALAPSAAIAATSSPAQAEGQAQTPNPAPQDAPTVPYSVAQGDTLWGIAQARYGDGGLWPVIARLNGIDDPRTLAVGAVIQVPADRAAAARLRARQDAEIAGYPRDGATGIPAAAA